MMGPLDFHQTLITLSTHFRFSQTSGYRTTKRNQAVGGVPDSRHLYWLAVDVVLDDPLDTAAFVKEAVRQGLSVLEEGDHLHIQVP